MKPHYAPRIGVILLSLAVGCQSTRETPQASSEVPRETVTAPATAGQLSEPVALATEAVVSAASATKTASASKPGTNKRKTKAKARTTTPPPLVRADFGPGFKETNLDTVIVPAGAVMDVAFIIDENGERIILYKVEDTHIEPIEPEHP